MCTSAVGEPYQKLFFLHRALPWPRKLLPLTCVTRCSRNSHRPARGGGPSFWQNCFRAGQVIIATTFCHSDETSCGEAEISFLLERNATPSCQRRKSYVDSTVPVLRMAARRAAKTRKLATHCEKMPKLDFSNGGQPAPSQAAPRVGGFSPRTSISPCFSFPILAQNCKKK